MTTPTKSPAALRRPGQGLLWSHIAATLLTAAEFILLQAIAIGLTTGVYLMAPLLDAGADPKFADWIRVFQIVSPTITITGGAAIVISSYIYAKKAQEYYDFAIQTAERAAQSNALIELANARAAQSDALAQQFSDLAQQFGDLAERSKARAEQSDARAELAEAEVARLTARLAQLENGRAATPEQPH